MITTDELTELELLCERSIQAADTLSDALKATAARHDMDAPGLRQYVTARVRDKLDALQRREDTLAQLRLFEHNGGAV